MLALGAIMVYIWFRFEWQFGVGAMISTLHDVITTVGLFAIFQLEFNLTTLAAILTIAGYSINDTVVIYDRMRESMRKYRTMPFRDLINLALNETLSRTILTVSTVALAVLSLLFFGGEVLRGFSIAMLWGIVIGTYSSLFIAAPILYYVQPNRRCDRQGGGASPAGAPGARLAADPAMELTTLSQPGRQVIERYAAERVSRQRHDPPRAGAGVRRPHDRLGRSAAITEAALAPVVEHGGVEMLLLGLGRRDGAGRAGAAGRVEVAGHRASKRWTPALPAAPTICCWPRTAASRRRCCRRCKIGVKEGAAMIIDCHGHYTTSPRQHEAWRSSRSRRTPPASRRRRARQ